MATLAILASLGFAGGPLLIAAATCDARNSTCPDGKCSATQPWYSEHSLQCHAEQSGDNRYICCLPAPSPAPPPSGINLEFPAGRGAQGVTCFISMCCLLYFFCKRPNVGWENLWVQSMEMIFYGLALGFNMEPLKLENGNEVVWVRYVSWMMTCPVLLCQISGLPEHGEFEGQSVKKTVILMLANQAMILGGVSAAFFTEWYFKLPLVTVSFMAFGICLYIVGSTCFAAFMSYPGRAKKALVMVATAFIVGWSVFPVLYLLGPEAFDVISQEASLIAHCAGDLLSKNFFGYVSYNLNWNVLPKTIGEMAETNGEALATDLCDNALDKQKTLEADWRGSRDRSRGDDRDDWKDHTLDVSRPSTRAELVQSVSPQSGRNSACVSGRNSPSVSGKSTPPTSAQLVRRGSFAQPVKVRTPTGGSTPKSNGNNTPNGGNTPVRQRSGGSTPIRRQNSVNGTGETSRSGTPRRKRPSAPVEVWDEQDVSDLLSSLGFHSAAQMALEASTNGELLASMSFEELKDELKLSSLQVKRLQSAMGRNAPVPSPNGRGYREDPFAPASHSPHGLRDMGELRGRGERLMGDGLADEDDLLMANIM